jgi:hypothetical protein
MIPATRAPRRRRVPGVVAAHGALVRALLRRELRPSRVLAALAATGAAAAAFGHYLARRGVLAPGLAPGSGGPAPGIALAGAAPAPGEGGPPEVVALAMLARLLPLPFAVGAAYLVIDRVAADHEAAWLPPLVAGGPPGVRTAYLLAVLGGALAAAVPLGAAAMLAFALGAGAPPVGAARATLAALPGAAGFTLAVACYAAACATLARRRRPALALALLGVLAPLAAVAWWQGSTGRAPPHALVALLATHAPLLSWRSSAEVLARHALYSAVTLLLLCAGAPRLVARHP